MKHLPARIAIFGVLAALSAQSPDTVRARQKAELIESDKAPRGSVVSFTLAEVNAFAAEEAQREVGDAVKNPRVTLGASTVTGSATLDFVKLQTARGQVPGWLTRRLLEGERDVIARVHVQSGRGQAQIDIEEVRINGVAVPQSLLDLIIEYYLTPRYPDAKIGRPFELRHNVEGFDISPQGVRVRIGG